MGKKILVEAIATGYYGEERQREGDKFIMKEEDFFSKDKNGEKIIVEEDGEQFYKTCSWVNALDMDYQGEVAEEKTVVKKKRVPIGNVDSKIVDEVKAKEAEANKKANSMQSTINKKNQPIVAPEKPQANKVPVAPVQKVTETEPTPQAPTTESKDLDVI